MTASSAAASGQRASQARGGGLAQASASGTRITAPAASPSHHVRQTVSAALPAITPPSSCARTPTVALRAVPAAIASSVRPSPPMLASGGPDAITLRISTAATSASSTLPAVCISAVPSGSTL